MLILLGVATAAVAWALIDRRGLSHPITLAVAGWAVLLLIEAVNPLNLDAPGPEATLVVAVGLVGLSTGALVPLPVASAPRLYLYRYRLPAIAALSAGLLLFGLLAFRSRIASTVGGSFGSLTASDIRRAQSGEARGGGFGVLLFSIAPVVAAVGVCGALYYKSRWWWTFVVLTLGVTLQSPGRTNTLTVVMSTTVFFLYVRRLLTAKRRMSRARTYVALAAVAIGSVAYFQSVGVELGKADAGLIDAGLETTLPPVLIAPAYQFGSGLPALGVAIRERIDPVAGNHGRTIFIAHRAWSLIDPNNPPPDTVAGFVPTPVPTNLYTAFGDMYFDFGILGVLMLSATLGLVGAVAHRRAMKGRLEWCWVASVALTMVAVTPMGFPLFSLSTLVQLSFGFMTFRWVRSPRGLPQSQQHSRAAAHRIPSTS